MLWEKSVNRIPEMTPTGSALIIGADSALGKLVTAYLNLHKEPVIGSTRKKEACNTDKIFLDLSEDIDDSWTPPASVSVAYICAAVTSLEQCRINPIQSALVNVQNTVKIASLCMQNGIFVIFPSTNQVFDGSIPLRRPGDPVSPKTEYGRQKAEAEKSLLALEGDLAIVRFTKIIYPRLPLIREWMDALGLHQVIHPFSDYRMAPVPAPLAVECLYKIADKRIRGIHHISAPLDISYADAAHHIADRMHATSDLVRPRKTEDFGVFLEHNPAYTALDASDIEKKLAIRIPNALASIDRVFFP
ncbi:sugar nucleotide-binding protein [Methanoregula sp. UBA64]|jgi:dTDP-4-dehydrorhamnose reductase|uniref:sugar nucleotide-binding protein n=1 Tax=Methanoregula sp. UBA64 TaxID=1915554 RepID=UPI0025EC80AA|nr:sugar nucleotide-binding protein [Methanoregula sp. UBA64]